MSRRQYRKWSAEETAQLRARYPHEDTSTLAAAMGMTRRSVYRKAELLGLKKSPERTAQLFAANAKRLYDFRIAPGFEPWNKGLRGAYRIKAGSKRGKQFQPGNKPPGYRAIGSELLRSDGHLYRKVVDEDGTERIRPVYQLLWESHHGKIPPGHIVAFRDGKYDNLSLENLELVTPSDMMRRNTVHRYPQPIKELIRLKARITRTVNQRSRYHEKQA
jgi:hypothetical protein